MFLETTICHFRRKVDQILSPHFQSWMPRPGNAAFKCFNLSLQWNPEEITSAKTINWTRSHFRRSRLSSIFPFLNKGPIRQAYLPAIKWDVSQWEKSLKDNNNKNLPDLSVRNGQLKILHLSAFSLQSVCPLFLLFLHSSFQLSPCFSVFSLLSCTFYLFLSLLSLSFFLFTLLVLNFPFSSLALFFFPHAHIQIRFNFELFFWTSNQKGLTPWNRTWATKRANCSYLLPFIRFYSEDWIFLLPKTGFRPQETLRGKSSGLKSDIFYLSS